jgi:flavin reductase (DIM6/NTAB) family NADH-FMN oxidoreductase RutF
VSRGYCPDVRKEHSEAEAGGPQSTLFEGRHHAEPAGRSADYRRAIARFATGVAIVTTRVDDVDVAMTVNSLASVSLVPVLVLFCADKAARFHDAVVGSRHWAVSVLGVDDEPASRWFATRGRRYEARLGGHPTRPGPITGLPLFPSAIATLECRTWKTVDAGDHTVIFGEVLGVDVPLERQPPLLYFESGYWALPT